VDAVVGDGIAVAGGCAAVGGGGTAVGAAAGAHAASMPAAASPIPPPSQRKNSRRFSPGDQISILGFSMFSSPLNGSFSHQLKPG